MDLTITPVDVDDDAEVAAYHQARTRADDTPYSTPLSLIETAAWMRRPNPYAGLTWWLAREVEGGPVGYASMELPLADNRDLALLELGIVPDARRRGYGTALLDEVLTQARAAGRSSALGDVIVPVGERDGAGVHLLERTGMTLRIVDRHSVLDLPIDRDACRALAARIAPWHEGYTLHGWTGSCPEPWAEQYATLLGLLMAEAPMDDLELEPERYDVARLRDTEEEWVDQGRLAHVHVAVAPDGSLAGHTQLILPTHDPRNAFQWDTLVRREHRGHRLGLALKLANQLSAADALADRDHIHTWNAASNAPMIAVNTELGYRPVTEILAYQGPL